MKTFKRVLSFAMVFLFLGSFTPNLRLLVKAAASVNVTFKLKAVPQNTPSDASIYMVGDFNGWNPMDESYKLVKGEDNTYSITLSLTEGQALQYKYTRGSWDNVEKDAAGNELQNRTYSVPAQDVVVEDSVANWKDRVVIVPPSSDAVEFISATLVGNFMSKIGMGNDWTTTNDKGLMRQYADGLYEITVDFTQPVTDGEYKIAINRGWNTTYTGKKTAGNGNTILNVATAQKVTFRYDSKTNEVFDSINDSDKFKTAAAVTGTMAKSGGKDWAPSDNTFKLDYIGGGFYKKSFTLKAGTYEYKVAYNNDWGNGEVGSNVGFTIDTDKEVTFLSNPLRGICTDSITSPAVATTASLIGTVRLGNNEWNETMHGFEFAPLSTTGKLVYSTFLPEGSYEFKAALNYSWTNSIPGGDNQKITIPGGGKYVVFVCDLTNKNIIESINNNNDTAIALGLKEAPVVVTSPVVNANGTVTFNYKDTNATSVYLAGNMTDWAAGKKAMTKDSNGVWSITLRLGDAGGSYEYKYIVDGNWITDPSNINQANGNSLLTLEKYTGRKVVLAGTIQTVAGESAWTPGSEKTKLQYEGNGLYSLVIPKVPAGNYEYKVAMGSWAENYGLGAEKDGPNIPLAVTSTQDVKFIYSDDSHSIVDSITYKVVAAELKGTNIPTGTKLTDPTLSGVYSVRVTPGKGTYTDWKLTVDGAELPVGTITSSDNSSVITVSYDPITNIVFNDASTNAIALDKLYFNSRELQYKTPYGAVAEGTEVTFNLRAGKNDLTQAKVILLTPYGTQVLNMSKNGTFDYDSKGDYDRWTASFTPDKMSMNKYYFVVSNGSDVKAYGDDDGYFGAGKADNLGKIKQYELNVYDKNFTTPDWMKNGVIYQIFPDRFFNGNLNNDYDQKLARGNTPYEFYDDWYAIPEDPQIENDPGYAGTKGDGQWSNEMYGGDLKGVEKKLDYLEALGVTVLYFNPISQSISNHRYDTTDYKAVDPLLGHMEDFVNLAEAAKKRGMHIILDGVFNHVSDDSIYFDRYNKYVAKGKPIGAYQYWSRVYDLVNAEKINIPDAEIKVQTALSAQGITDFHYKDWFYIENKVIDKDKDGNPVPVHYSYEGWWGYDSMPVIQSFGGSEYNVKSWDEEIIDGSDSNTRLWLRKGSSGWRLDVANEVSDETWRHFRTAVKEEGDNVIIGEIWTDASKYILGDMYDSVMNYRFRSSVLNFVRGTDESDKVISAKQSMEELEVMREQYPREAFEAMLNLVGSHDTQRAISALDGYKKSVKGVAEEATSEAKAKMRMIPLIQMTYPGAPCIYYGDESGVVGADDPDNRRTMNWGKGDKELVEWYAALANIRNSYEVLRTGDILPASVDASYAEDVISYSRKAGSAYALIAVNRRTTALDTLEINAAGIPNGTTLTNALNPAFKYTVKDGKVLVHVPAQGGVILVSSYKTVAINSEALKDAYDANFAVEAKVRVTGMTLDKTEISIKGNEVAGLKTVFTPANASCTDVIWESSNPSIASVNSLGQVKGVAKGEAVITVTSKDGDFTAICKVTVTSTVLPKTGQTVDTSLLLFMGFSVCGVGLLLSRKPQEEPAA